MRRSRSAKRGPHGACPNHHLPLAAVHAHTIARHNPVRMLIWLLQLTVSQGASASAGALFVVSSRSYNSRALGGYSHDEAKRPTGRNPPPVGSGGSQDATRRWKPCVPAFAGLRGRDFHRLFGGGIGSSPLDDKAREPMMAKPKGPTKKKATATEPSSSPHADIRLGEMHWKNRAARRGVSLGKQPSSSFE